MIDFTNLPVRNKTNAGANGIAENVTDFLFWWIYDGYIYVSPMI